MLQQQQPATADKPDARNVPIRTIAFEILEKCNLYCDFCVRSASYKLEAMLTAEQFQSRVNKVAAALPKLDLVALTGGEPFLHPEIVEFVKIAKQCSRLLSITTNATVHKLPALKELASLKYCHLIISLDGPDETIHDFVRGKAGAFAGLVKFTEYCREYGLPFLMNMTVNEKNYLRVYETAQLAQRLGSQDISIALVKPEGRGTSIEGQDALFCEVGRQTMLAQRDLAPRGLKVRFTDPLAHIFDVRLSQPGIKRGCGATSGALHIQCSGKVLICTSCKEGLGNIDDPDFVLDERAAGDERMCRIYDRTTLGGACGGCEFLQACGGCRCRATHTEEGFGGPDPLCPKNVMPFKDASTEAELQTALSKQTPKCAKEPDAIMKFLTEWKRTEQFDRNNPDFIAQKRWGHNIDIGGGRTFEGEHGWRHVEIVRRWLNYGAIPSHLENMRILDVGCWTGGSALLLSALGAQVDVVEENQHNREAIKFLAEQFQLPVRIIADSIYDLALDEQRDYDFISIIGSLTRCSDLLVALRTAFNHLRDGGKCLIETQTSYEANGEDEFWGTSRPGWVWHNPSRLTLFDLLKTAGFDRTVVVDFDANRRIQLFGQRIAWAPMRSRTGLSVPKLR